MPAGANGRQRVSSVWRMAERIVLEKTGETLVDWLRRRRLADGCSYFRMASELHELGVLVTYETVRAWCRRVAA